MTGLRQVKIIEAKSELFLVFPSRQNRDTDRDPTTADLIHPKIVETFRPLLESGRS